MKKLYLLVAVLLMAGCKASKPVPATQTQAISTPTMSNIDVRCVGDCTGIPIPSLTDKQKIALLRVEAHKRGLKWRIFCMDWQDDPNHQFMGEAAPHDGTFNLYIEHGGKGLWLEEADTQANAAYALYLAIQDSQTHPVEAENEKPKNHEHKKFCPPELRGD